MSAFWHLPALMVSHSPKIGVLGPTLTGCYSVCTLHKFSFPFFLWCCDKNKVIIWQHREPQHPQLAELTVSSSDTRAHSVRRQDWGEGVQKFGLIFPGRWGCNHYLLVSSCPQMPIWRKTRNHHLTLGKMFLDGNDRKSASTKVSLPAQDVLGSVCSTPPTLRGRELLPTQESLDGPVRRADFSVLSNYADKQKLL